MAFNYTGLKTTATNLIQNFGGTVSLVVITPGTYNTATGETDNTETETEVSGVKIDFNKNEIDGTIVKANDIKIYLPADTTISKTDKIKLSGNTYNIIDIKEVKPGDTILYYELQVRK